MMPQLSACCAAESRRGEDSRALEAVPVNQTYRVEPFVLVT